MLYNYEFGVGKIKFILNMVSMIKKKFKEKDFTI